MEKRRITWIASKYPEGDGMETGGKGDKGRGKGERGGRGRETGKKGGRKVPREGKRDNAIFFSD